MPGAQITIRDAFGALVPIPGGNPRVSDATGTWSASLAVGTYALVIAKGDASRARPLIVQAMDLPRTIIAETVIVVRSAPASLAETVVPVAMPLRTIITA